MFGVWILASIHWVHLLSYGIEEAVIEFSLLFMLRCEMAEEEKKLEMHRAIT